MRRMSARVIGQQLGKNAREVNKMLEAIGFIVQDGILYPSGSPSWALTDVGRLHGEQSHNPRSNGHIWDQEVVEILKKTFKL